MATLGELGETRLLSWLVGKFSGEGKHVLVGNGNDAAVVRLYGKTSFKVDTLVVAGLPKNLSYYDVGWKAVVACASDLAAVGSRPMYAVVSFSGPRTMQAKHFREAFRGIGDALSDLGATLVGGDLSETGEVCLGIAMLGKAVGRPLLRRRARPGDLIAVSRPFGLEPLGLRVLYGKISVNSKVSRRAVRRFKRPRAEVEYGVTLSRLGFVSSCTDSSDGLTIAIKELIGDKMDAVIDSLPADEALAGLDEKTRTELVLWGGEEYALVYTYGAVFDEKLVAALRKIGRKRIIIGKVREGSGKIYMRKDSGLQTVKIGGWRQFESVPLET